VTLVASSLRLSSLKVDPSKRVPGCKPLGFHYPQRRWVPHSSAHTMTTYQQLREYFTEQELDDAAVIARHSQHHFPGSTYAEIFIEILVQMRLYPTGS
jgi:hypothetical protein